MQDANSSENTHGSYEKANPYKYRCIMYMYLANYGATQISLVVGMSLSTVKYIVKRVDKTGSPESRKGSRQPRKIDERTERHLVQIVCKDPFASFSRLRASLKNMESCFWASGFGPLVFLDGNANQDQYVNTLAQNFLPWFQNLSWEQNRSFVFQEDNASCHTGLYLRWWKDSHEIRGFDY
ncbi:Homeodomain-like DNA binding domain-containing transcription factor [Phycomyces blakesleeanus NRRL 1555(-)]|uniref:Homeodomain-like DNA binding domain-containing transcription factor n=1 Tax=Phycomyces blakesleeanus (strain ATCC 8743b / DSM 1359 / FGSC 10004 / NBRC 33097 / NRRL 1555) TaxID=763407 RepID=A0A167PKP1_PHYB8|nr:Homeodomain-like DNA binding domain-containing transcription factor [Phycomyces blakesleeanus NRRL 1555(-)]OAD78129.1 Homeodomain-like DNA binding domain-containing transcription factor [Phycomyces blakesleeanus NRRL 1555(-)]|eukprot:XP_018296169.1 Homeodomain-like DNA binding domain-containing transcription factor [Phycomyces blakesleeanus NRRL 1555(-)]